ncbi:hypothetical protein [Endozoicomonas atrinae]|nr:hypothetical protein [Endozoicomonas atrinae]
MKKTVLAMVMAAIAPFSHLAFASEAYVGVNYTAVDLYQLNFLTTV